MIRRLREALNGWQAKPPARVATIGSTATTSTSSARARGSSQQITAPGERARSRRFALRFALFAAIGLTLYAFPTEHGGPVERAFEVYLSGYARLAGMMLSWFEPDISVRGTVISGRAALMIVKNCDAMDLTLLLAAAILALEAPLLNRLLAVALGVLAIVALNLARICTLYFVQLWFPRSFDTIHLEVWPPLLVLATALLFFTVARQLAVHRRESYVAK